MTTTNTDTRVNGFALVLAKKAGGFKVVHHDLGWNRAKAQKACVSACAKHLADIRVAKVSFVYAGLGAIEALTIDQVF